MYTLVFIFFMKALDTILTDSGFQVPSTDAAEALKTATAVSQWCKKHENFAVLRNFCKYITLQFKDCLGKDSQTLRSRKDKMWGKFHLLRTSDVFILQWKDFLRKSVGLEAAPTFYQFVSHEFFKDVVKHEF